MLRYRPTIHVIAFAACDGSIYKDALNDPEHVKYCEKWTKGKLILFGRKTWEALPPMIRPFPDAFNTVLSKTYGLDAYKDDQVAVINGMEMLVEHPSAPEVFAIASTSILEQLLERGVVDYLHIVRFHDIASTDNPPVEILTDDCPKLEGENWQILQNAPGSSTSIRLYRNNNSAPHALN